MPQSITLNPIGIIHSPYKTRNDAPFQGILSNETFELELFPNYVDGLKDIEDFSHLIILYYAHKSRRTHLQTMTPWDSTPHGVFTTCSPSRPNPILFSVVQLIERRNNQTLIVRNLDALDGTPLLDIKPYVPKLVLRKHVRLGWMENKVLTL